MSIYDENDRPIDPTENHKKIDIYQPEGMDYPIIEQTYNALLWPEAPKGRIDLENTYEISTVPEDPDTPLETIETLARKKVTPN